MVLHSNPHDAWKLKGYKYHPSSTGVLSLTVQNFTLPPAMYALRSVLALSLSTRPRQLIVALDSTALDASLEEGTVRVLSVAWPQVTVLSTYPMVHHGSPGHWQSAVRHSVHVLLEGPPLAFTDARRAHKRANFLDLRPHSLENEFHPHPLPGIVDSHGQS